MDKEKRSERLFLIFLSFLIVIILSAYFQAAIRASRSIGFSKELRGENCELKCLPKAFIFDPNNGRCICTNDQETKSIFPYFGDK